MSRKGKEGTIQQRVIEEEKLEKDTDGGARLINVEGRR
jgi:hypothetical protein